MEKEKQFGTASAVADLLGISEASAYRLARERRIPPGTYVRLNGRTVRFDIPALKRWIAEGGNASGASEVQAA
jgi:excisionase family DNA binding protein